MIQHPPHRPPTAARRALALVVGAILTVSLWAARPVTADASGESYLSLDIGDTTLSGRVELDFDDIRELFDLDLAGTPEQQLAEIDERLVELQTYAEDNTRIGVDGRDWFLVFDGVELLDETDVAPGGDGYVVLPFTVGLDVRSVPRLIDIAFTPFLVEIDDRSNAVVVANDWKRGAVEETDQRLVLTPESPTGQLDLGDPDRWRTFRSSIDLGVESIRTGPDHVVFVLVLLLPTVLVLTAGRRRPARGSVGSLRRVGAVAAMFALAHSMTFLLTGLDWMPALPTRLLGTLIAGSVAVAALHNVVPALRRREAALGFAFGLFHGMGLAALVAVPDVDIDRTTRLASLLGRNVGIEIGVLTVIVVTVPALLLLRRTRSYLPLMYAASVFLIVLAGMWVIERATATDLDIGGGIDDPLRWPRSLYAMVAVTAARRDPPRGRVPSRTAPPCRPGDR